MFGLKKIYLRQTAETLGNAHFQMFGGFFNSQKKYWKTPKNKTVRHRFASRMPQNPGTLKRLHKCV